MDAERLSYMLDSLLCSSEGHKTLVKNKVVVFLARDGSFSVHALDGIGKRRKFKIVEVDDDA